MYMYIINYDVGNGKNNNVENLHMNLSLCVHIIHINGNDFSKY